MREIKFRVWDKHHKRMRYLGNDVHDDISFDNENRAMYYNLQCGDGGASTVEEDDERYGFSPLMQYTGLKDKNGKEIYEGDIISIVDSIGTHICEVKFLNGCFVSVKVGEGDSDRVCLCEDIDNFPHTIIGNIYENPKLLQVNN